MAVSVKGHVITMDAAGDSTSSVFPHAIKVNQISVVSAGAANPIVLRQGNSASGTVLYDFGVAANTTVNIDFSQGQWFESITIDSVELPAGAVVRVHVM